MNSIKTRIKEIRRELGLSQSQLGSYAGVGKSSVSQWENGNTKSLLAKNLVLICKATGINPYWLETGKGEKYTKNIKTSEKITSNMFKNSQNIKQLETYDKNTTIDYNEIEISSLRSSEGEEGVYTITEGENVRFPKDLLDKANVLPNDAFLLHINDNSMHPVLRIGSLVAINKADNHLIDGQMYAIDHNGELRVKKIYRMAGGGIRLSSYNSEYTDEIYKKDEMNQIKIIGAVFWYSVLLSKT